MYVINWTGMMTAVESYTLDFLYFFKCLPWSKNETVWHSDYLDSHQYLLLVRGEVVTFSQENLSEGSLSKLSLQHNVVPLNVLDDCKKRRRKTL